jgi:hypothetical protein
MPKPGPCVCSRVRRIARKLSSHYHTLLSPEEIIITQYSLLANSYRAGQLRHNVLVDRLICIWHMVAFKMGRRQGGPSRTGGERAHI